MRAALPLALLAALVTGHAGAAPKFLAVNTHQPAPDILDSVKDLGMPWVRIDFNWFQLQPTSGSYDWALFDKLVDDAVKRGLQVFPTLGYAPAWASEPDADGKPNNQAPKPGEYQKVCQAVAARYQGKVTHWGLWNEPNLKDFFEGTRQQWKDRVLIEGVKGIKAGCPACKVLGPELASIGNEYNLWLDEGLKALKAAGLALDIITFHIYAGFLETKTGGWQCWDGDLFEHKLEKQRTCFGIPVGVPSLREVLLANGLGNQEVWITETGYTAPASDANATALQLTFYRRVVEEQLERPWWTGTFFYEIVDDNLIADKWGMAVRTGSSPSFPASYQLKPVWAFVKKAIAKQPLLGGSGADCDDGLDNDGDGKIDFGKDPECSSATDPSEGSAPAADASVPAKDGPLTGKEAGPVGDASVPGREGSVASERGASDGAPARDGARVDAASTAGAESGCGCGLRGAAVSGGELLLGAALLGLLCYRRRRA